MHLTSNGCVTIRREMLTYSRVRSAFAAACALPLDVIYILKKAFVFIFVVIILKHFVSCKI